MPGYDSSLAHHHLPDLDDGGYLVVPTYVSCGGVTMMRIETK